METKKPKCKKLLVALILGTLWLLGLIVSFSEIASNSAGGAVATMLVAPHMFFLFLAVIFNAIAFFQNKLWAVITAGVLYCISGLVFLLYVIFLVPSIILTFMSISTIKKFNSNE